MIILQLWLSINTIYALSNEKTTFENCVDCYANSWTHCIDDDYQYSMCCKTDIEQCTKGFKYCTTKLTQNIYRVLTCPMDSCPSGSIVTEHEAINTTKVATRSWSYFEPASFCKMIFKAKSTINGKITVEIQRAD